MLLSSALRDIPPPRLTPNAARTTTGLIILSVAILDYITPAEFDLGLFYAIGLAICAWSGSRKFLWGATSVSIALVFAMARLGAPPQTNWLITWINRIFTALSLATVALIVHNWMAKLSAVEGQRILTRRLLESLDLAQVMIRKLDGTILFWSYGAELLYRWSAEEATGRISHDLLKTDFGPERLEHINLLLTQDWQWIGELEHVRKDGDPVWVVSHWTLDTSDLFQFPIVIQIDQDITELRLGDNRFRKLTELMPQSVWQVSPSGRILYTNRWWREYCGRDHGEITIYNAVSQFGHPDDASALLAGWDRAYATGQMEPWEIRYLRHDGVYRWFAGQTVAVRGEAGQIIHWIMIANEIDPLKPL